MVLVHGFLTQAEVLLQHSNRLDSSFRSEYKIDVHVSIVY